MHASDGLWCGWEWKVNGVVASSCHSEENFVNNSIDLRDWNVPSVSATGRCVDRVGVRNAVDARSVVSAGSGNKSGDVGFTRGTVACAGVARNRVSHDVRKSDLVLEVGPEQLAVDKKF